MNDLEDKGRLQYMDMAKGIGIIAVIIGHMNIWKLNHIIYSFHMPLFFLISGYFISWKYSYKTYTVKKIRQLIIPYIFTCLLILGLTFINGLLFNNSSSTILSSLKSVIMSSVYGSGNLNVFGIEKIGAIWFLLADFFALIFIYAIGKIKFSIILVLIIALIGYFTSLYVWLPFSLQAGMFASIYVYVGYIWKKKKIFDYNPPRILLIVFALIWIATVVLGNINMAKNLYSPFVISVLGPIFASYIIIYICKNLSRNKKSRAFPKLMAFYGQNSLVILCFHLLELEFFPWESFQNFLSGVGFNNIFIILISFLLKMLYVTVCVYMVKKIKFLEHIFPLPQ